MAKGGRRALVPSSTPSSPASETADALALKLDSLPKAPGCYLFSDADGVVVYVGKAKSLRARVRSYFQEGGTDDRVFIPILRRIAADLETVVTATEKEAAVLENELIKKHQPRFNVKLRDDKDFLSLRLDTGQPWPRLEAVRRPSPDGARYYGPYHSATSARRTLHLVNKHFQLRTCSDADFASRRRPCLQHQIKRCPAPCVLDVDAAVYAQQVRAVGLFLEGRHDELTGELRERMDEASRRFEYELAAVYRDQLRAVLAIREAQRIVYVKDVDQDVIGLYREGGLVEIELLLVKKGRLTETLSFSLRNMEIPDDEVLSGFLASYYGDMAGPTQIPDEVLLPVLPEAASGTAEWLGERRGRRVLVLLPRRGPRAKLLEMAKENARHAFHEKRRATDDIEARLEELQERLRLSTLPRRIECCDISHLGGGDTVGSIVSLVDGIPDKKRYRSFNVRTQAEGDDYAAMYEVLARRFRRAREGAEDDWDLPDLLVVDGGRGQLGVALSAARDLGLHELAIVGLAKERESATGEKVVDRVYLPGQKNGIPLRSTSSSLFFLARARDEAHRFANHVRKRLGKSRRLKSEIDAIPGLGESARKTLLRTLGSMAAIRGARDDQILAVQGITRRHLTALRRVIPAPAEAVTTEG